MKKTIFGLAILLWLTGITYAQNVGIGTTNPHQSAILDVQSSDKGFLPPRLTTNQRNAIQDPAVGLMIWNTTCKQVEVYNGVVWTTLFGSAACGDTTGNGIIVCNQMWMNTNLNVSHYRNGDPIPQVSDSAQWLNLTTGAWCWYKNDSANYAAAYGKLYNWHAVNDPRGLAPTGWHIPSKAEWDTLSICLGGNGVAGGALKEVGTQYWYAPNSGASNIYGFSARPGGQRRWGDAIFYNIREAAFFWTATQDDEYLAWARSMGNDGSFLGLANYYKRNGFSVRCVKD